MIMASDSVTHLSLQWNIPVPRTKEIMHLITLHR